MLYIVAHVTTQYNFKIKKKSYYGTKLGYLIRSNTIIMFQINVLYYFVVKLYEITYMYNVADFAM